MRKLCKYRFSWDLDGQDPHDERIHWRYVEAQGNSLEELLDDCAVGREDWHGNELAPIRFGELPDRVMRDIETSLQSFMAEQDESAAGGGR